MSPLTIFFSIFPSSLTTKENYISCCSAKMTILTGSFLIRATFHKKKILLPKILLN